MKKTIGLILMLALLLCCTGAMAFTLKDSNNKAVFEYEYTSTGEVSIKKYLGDDGNVVIPDQIDGKPVTTIGDKAFYACSNLTSVTIPGSVTSIGQYAFYMCQSLKTVTIPGSVTSIGEWAFAISGLTSVTIPDGVTTVGVYAFRSCTSLKGATLPGSLTAISAHMFDHCTSLKSVTIPYGVTSIGAGAFTNCASLKSVTIPESVTSIGRAAFHTSALQSITIPSGVTSLEQNVFTSCANLTSVTINGRLEKIGTWAFVNCPSLEKLVFTSAEPNPTIALGLEPFDNSSALTIYVPKGSEQAYSKAFENANLSIPIAAIPVPFVPKTGDNSRPVLWLALLCMASAAMLTLKKRAYN